MGDVIPFPAGPVDRDELRRHAERNAQDDTPLPPGPVAARHVIWQGPDKPAFIQAAPHPHDPPGVVRWIVVQPDGRRVPPAAKAAGE